jgi:hypothetical protein
MHAAFSQRTAEGYIIGANNDSTSVTFKLPRSMPAPIMEMYDQPFDFFHLKDEVEVIGSNGSTQRITPRDVKRVSFTYNSKNYELISKPINPYQHNFLSPEIIGPKIRLYYYTIVHQGTAYYGNGMKAKGGSSPWIEYFWTIERPYGKYLFVNSGMRKKELVSLLKQFFNDSDSMKSEIDQQFHGWLVDIPSALKTLIETYSATTVQ